MLCLVVIFVVAIGLAGWWMWVRPARSSSVADNLIANFELTKVSLATVAAAGACVGLVVAYRRQQTAEESQDLAVRAEDRIAAGQREDSRRDDTRLLNERFTSASQQLGSERAAIRLAGIYAMAALADDWEAQRQTCVDVLCGYFRMSSRNEGNARNGEPDEEVWKAIFQVIRDHLVENARTRWSGLRFNFRGARFTGQDLSKIMLDGSEKFDFRDSIVTAEGLTLVQSNFLKGDIDFEGATIEGCLNFAATALRREFSINVDGLKLGRGGRLHFNYANLQHKAIINLGVHLGEEGLVSFCTASLHGGRVNLAGLHMEGGRLDLRIGVLTTEGAFKWPDALLGTGTILVPEGDEKAGRLGIPIDHGGVVVMTDSRGQDALF